MAKVVLAQPKAPQVELRVLSSKHMPKRALLKLFINGHLVIFACEMRSHLTELSLTYYENRLYRPQHGSLFSAAQYTPLQRLGPVTTHAEALAHHQEAPQYLQATQNGQLFHG